MIINAFLRWVETAKAGDRARAAGALARAYANASIGNDERHAAEMAMIFLLDDPAPKVRLALAEGIADHPDAPRAVIVPLSEDQPEIAAQVILRSPVLTDADLVDLAARASDITRALIAHRQSVSRAVCAAVIEVGNLFDALTLLENDGACIGARSLKRICERHGDDAEIRAVLLDRDDLPCDARHALVEKVGAALAGDALVQAMVGSGRIERVAREACDVATIALAAELETGETEQLVEHLRACDRLTPVLLMQALCAGRIAFFAATMVNLSGQSEKRVRSILADGRRQAICALFETAGLGRDISALFAEAVLLWRNDARDGAGRMTVTARLAMRTREARGAASAALLEMIEGLAIAEQRQSARSFALLAAQDAA
ncbi:DUF2336 domain-containing protein [Rhizobium sp. GN54]|uniref:DUF2336 domain-containing protein n=1 Tax=Rhizobium sp. GN54 TaxID=2898150 RepID=UPI001E287415|nr:DUF2336 domain-containing protein [Rhizobium sp. GN54]MCD2182163.1 DUF2336 domain-containing protein [Rhizobium sp. GN54]